ncbi:hypothetical protein C0Q70_12290 [Pomacea canaliculata]|uniref:Protein xylosyltransferase n=1 Tax=Pomacea canaliculata TaxID=400727 RepID=A0A2T7P137_POMCA|nr:hypothetical protein C0Q70_12290 [Pomacea canaliculata]
MKEVDCMKLFAGDMKELTRSKQVHKDLPALPTEKDITRLAKNCRNFVRVYGFIMNFLTEEERNFPIAYSILVFKDAHQVTQLLQAIYRPQNVYCIHVDQKADQSYRDTMAAIADCFHNVFLASRSVDVEWGRFTVLEPELICMRDLWPFKKWKYFINLTGQEFPLRTNFELVRILTAYNGANDVDTVETKLDDRLSSAGPPPHGIVPTMGSVHIAVNRDFVDYVLHSPVAQDLLEWTQFVAIPDETFFSSLNHNPQLGIRGSYKGDLPLLDTRPEMFANKFYQDYSRVALECLHQRLYNHTKDEFLGMMEFDTSYYSNLAFVNNTVTAEEATQILDTESTFISALNSLTAMLGMF